MARILRSFLTGFVLCILAFSLLAPKVVRAESVEVNHGYTYDYEIEDWDNYSETYGVTHDSENNVYVLGKFNGIVDFDLTDGIDNRTEVGPNPDVFLQRINSDGSYGWTRTWDIIYPSSVAVDNEDRVVVNLQYGGTNDFDPTDGVDSKTSVGSTYDVGIIRLNSDGSYDMGVNFGGTGIDYAHHMEIDQSNNIFATGRFAGTCDFDPGIGTDNRTSNGDTDAFVVKINEDGSHGFAVAVGGVGPDQSYAVDIDASGNIYYGGRFSSAADFNPGGGVDNKTGDTFISRINSDGSYDWAHGLTTSGGGIYAIGVDSHDNVYATGGFLNTTDFDPGPGTENRTSNGSADAFFTKFSSGGVYQYVRTWGSSGYDYGGGLDFDRNRNIYINGEFRGQTDFDPSVNVSLIDTPEGDFFINKFMSDGTYDRTFHSTTSSGSYQFYADNSMMTIDHNDTIYTSGTYSGTVDLDFTDSVDNFTSSAEDLFLTRINQTTYQQITGLAPSLTAKTLTDTDATDNTIQNGTSTTVRLSLSGTTPIADVTTTFSSDLDWSTVTADSDSTTGTVFAHNLTAADGTAGSFTLYIPKLPNHARVGICPGASSLAATTDTCTGLYYLTEGVDSNLSSTTIDGQDYWVVSGLTGTGGFSAVAGATATNTDAETLAETGQDQTTILIAATLLLVLSSVAYGYRKKLSI